MRPLRHNIHYKDTDFNPRTPCGVRHHQAAGFDTFYNFNPRTPCGVRPLRHNIHYKDTDFNPRTPCGVRPGRGAGREDHPGFQSTHPLRGATIPSWF